MLLIEHLGPVIGQFQDGPIYGWIEDQFGLRYHYHRTAPGYPDCGWLVMRQDECLLNPGVIYRAEPVLAPAASGEAH
ncbi:hypothetical protein [Pseudogulbenkiania sp. MAI-1]|uniref:hypothetical protein n=1 Tax=Pseudogulbenkiania sp. MAI-1 TaxID=990370 RepID=UPI00045EACC3|nr:hypothetical protein [Pseudogulbenkiania sp. MAI-1]